MSDGRHIEVHAPDGAAEAYLAGAAGAPGVLLYADGLGLRPRIEAMADRIAGWGFLVLAPHLFYRDGSVAELAPRGDLREQDRVDAFFAAGGLDRIAALTPARATADADAWVEALAASAASGPLATVGYCVGATFAVRVGGRFPERVAAVGCFHGGNLVTDAEDSPHLAIAGSRAAYCFGHADGDEWMPPAAIEALGETLAGAGRPSVNEVYAGAPHGYTMADTAMYDEAASERHFEAMRGLLDEALTDRLTNVC
jgi:carboxymethylenebutenolidase